MPAPFDYKPLVVEGIVGAILRESSTKTETVRPLTPPPPPPLQPPPPPLTPVLPLYCPCPQTYYCRILMKLFKEQPKKYPPRVGKAIHCVFMNLGAGRVGVAAVDRLALVL